MPPLPADFEWRLARHQVADVLDPPARRAAVSAVLGTTPEGTALLLMQRVEQVGDPWSGHVSMPGGRSEAGDRDLLHTALRETHEELGLDLSQHARLLCRLETLMAVAGRSIVPMDITPFVFRLEQPVTLSLGQEAQGAFWLPLEAVLDGSLDGETTIRRRGTLQRFPCWRYEGHEVWGMTYRMIRTLLRAGGGLA